MTRRAQARLGFMFAMPVLGLTTVFFIIPLVNAFFFSFVDYDGITEDPEFVGLGNFVEMLTDPAVWHALSNNVTWIIVGTAAPVTIGLVIALVLANVGRGGVVYRLIFFFPYVLPGVAIAVVWGWIYAPRSGWLNQALEWLGLGFLGRGWLGDPDIALYAVLATAVWAMTGFCIVVFLAALGGVDTELVDAARLDGAGPVQRTRYVVLPQIMPVFLMVVTLTLIGGFGVFDIIYVMTGGGPANATKVLGIYAYESAFTLNRIGYATTIALLITVLSVPFAIALNRLQRRLALEGSAA